MPQIRTLGLVAVVLLGACGGPATTADDRVASLSSAAPAASPSAAGAGRPQLRLDTSKAEADRLWTAYEDCLVGHGVKVNPTDQPGAVGDGPGRRLDQSGEPKAAYTACAGKLPLQPPELDEDRNPNYAAQWNDNVRCLRAHGVMVHVTIPGEWTWDSNDTPIPGNLSELQDSCLLEAFGGKTK